MDLYKATKLANGDFGNAVNLGGQINTPGNEMFPYVAPDGKLYFASDGHPGLGKLDLFVAERTDKGWEVKNLGSNINTVADDFGIFFTKYPTEGFLSLIERGLREMTTFIILKTKLPNQKSSMSYSMSPPKNLMKMAPKNPPQTRVVLYDNTNKNIGGDFSNQSR